MKAKPAKEKASSLRKDSELQKKHKNLEELIAKQGVSRTATFEHLLGTGVNLWNGDRDFKNFLDTVKAVRLEKG